MDRGEKEEEGGGEVFSPVTSREQPRIAESRRLSPLHSLSTRALRTARANHERLPLRTRTNTHTRSRGASSGANRRETPPRAAILSLPCSHATDNSVHARCVNRTSADR